MKPGDKDQQISRGPTTAEKFALDIASQHRKCWQTVIPHQRFVGLALEAWLKADGTGDRSQPNAWSTVCGLASTSRLNVRLTSRVPCEELR